MHALIIALLMVFQAPQVAHAASAGASLVDPSNFLAILLIVGPGLVATYTYAAVIQRNRLELNRIRQRKSKRFKRKTRNSGNEQLSQRRLPDFWIDAQSLPGLVLGIAFSMAGAILMTWYSALIGFPLTFTYLTDPSFTLIQPTLLLLLLVHTFGTVFVTAIFATIHARLAFHFPKLKILPTFEKTPWLRFWTSVRKSAANTDITVVITTKSGITYYGSANSVEDTDSSKGILLEGAYTEDDLINGLPVRPYLFIDADSIQSLGVQPLNIEPEQSDPTTTTEQNDGSDGTSNESITYNAAEGGDDEEE